MATFIKSSKPIEEHVINFDLVRLFYYESLSFWDDIKFAIVFKFDERHQCKWIFDTKEDMLTTYEKILLLQNKYEILR